MVRSKAACSCYAADHGTVLHVVAVRGLPVTFGSGLAINVCKRSIYTLDAMLVAPAWFV